VRDGAGGGNRTRDFCVEGSGIATMQRRRWSGQRESNPRSSLGTAPGFHYIMTGKLVGSG
jgi:hypothetical protein